MNNKRQTYNKWQESELKLLSELVKSYSIPLVAKIMNRTYPSVRGMVAIMGIKSVYNPGQETRKDLVRKKISSTLQGINLSEWEGYKETTNALIRKSVPYKQWRMSVFKRDWFACVFCKRSKSKNLKIEADHIKPFAFYPELRLEVSNGRTLCRDCHMQTDTWGGRVLKERII